MKKIMILPMVALALASCQQKIVYEVDYDITLDEANTYYAGDPVRFNIEGEVDNLLFYSGESGHEYQYRDRFTVAFEDVEKAELNFDIQARYGLAGGTLEDNGKGLEIFVSKEFQGLDGENAEADRKAIEEMYAGGMQGWTKLEYEEGASTKWTSHSWNISEYLDNFAIAIHYNPVYNGKDAQRTYWVKGGVDLQLKGLAPSYTGIKGFDLTTFMLNDWVKDPYEINQSNGSIVFNKSAADIIFQGAKGSLFDASIDGWVFSKGTPLNKVANDKAFVVKNLSNYVPVYEYTFEKAGTYKVVFVGTNSNIAGSSQQIIERQVVIMDRPVKE